MWLGLFDKLLFGLLLLTALQMPVVADQYLQYVSGYYESTLNQVESYRDNAARHGYRNVEAMLHSLRTNPDPVVRADANLKQQTLLELDDLQLALSVLQQGHLFEKTAYMLAPSRWSRLQKVMTNYQPGLPLDLVEAGWCALLAFLSSILLMWPAKSFNKRRHVKKAIASDTPA